MSFESAWEPAARGNCWVAMKGALGIAAGQKSYLQEKSICRYALSGVTTPSFLS